MFEFLRSTRRKIARLFRAGDPSIIELVNTVNRRLQQCEAEIIAKLSGAENNFNVAIDTMTINNAANPNTPHQRLKLKFLKKIRELSIEEKRNYIDAILGI